MCSSSSFDYLLLHYLQGGRDTTTMHNFSFGYIHDRKKIYAEVSVVHAKEAGTLTQCTT